MVKEQQLESIKQRLTQSTDLSWLGHRDSNECACNCLHHCQDANRQHLIQKAVQGHRQPILHITAFLQQHRLAHQSASHVHAQQQWRYFGSQRIYSKRCLESTCRESRVLSADGYSSNDSGERCGISQVWFEHQKRYIKARYFDVKVTKVVHGSLQ